jgi:hypothetical protein
MRPGLLIGTIALAMTCMPLLAESGHRGRSVSVTNRGDQPIDRCDQIRVTFDDVEAARSEEEIAVARSRDPLRVSVSDNSGLWVQASDRRDFSIRACKAASSPEYLNRISLAFENGQFAARGPDEREWMVYLLVSVPRDAALDLEASNGPLSVRGSAGSVVVRTSNGPLSISESSGTVRALAKNGPISLKACSGDVQAEAVNGPISVSRSRGDLRLETQNGPISVELSGRRWEGAGLVARAVNGPLSLKIPEDYQSGTVVEMSGRSPVSCRARACGQARKNWDEDSRRIEFGGAAAVVRLSTVNGPVSIVEVSERGD